MNQQQNRPPRAPWHALAATGIGLLLLTGCDLETEVELYIDDLVTVAEEDESITTPVEIGMEMASMDQCREETDNLETIMREQLPDFEAKECVSHEFQAKLLAEASIPVIPGSDLDNHQALFAVGVQPTELNDGRRAYQTRFLLDPERLDDLSNRIERQYYQQVNFADSSMSVRLNNDQRQDWTVHGNYLFMNATPIVIGSVDLERRDRVQLRLSDVARASMLEHGIAPLVTLVSNNN